MVKNKPSAHGLSQRDGTAVPLHLQIATDPTVLSAVREDLDAWARLVGLVDEQADAFVLATYEAVANAIEHGYREQHNGIVTVLTWRTVDRTVVVEVSDHGQWRTPPADPGTRGQGIPLMRALADDVKIDHDDQGTTVRLHWRLSGRSAKGRRDGAD